MTVRSQIGRARVEQLLSKLSSFWILAVVCVIGLALVFAVARRDYESELAKQTLMFERTIDTHVERLRDHLQERVQTARVVAGVFEPPPGLQPGALDRWTDAVLPLLPEVYSFVWVPRVPPRDVGLVLDGLKQSGVNAPALLGAGRHPIDPTRVSDVLYPVFDILPKTDANWQSLGLDLGRLPLPREALDKAARSGEPAATAPLELVQLPGVAALVIYAPVTKRRDGVGDLSGFVGFSYRFDQLIGTAIGKEALSFRLLDGERVIFSHGRRDPSNGVVTRSLNIAGRAWQLSYDTPAALSRVAGQTALRTALVGAGALGALLLLSWLALGTSRRHLALADARIQAEQRLRLALDASETGLWEWNTIDGSIVCSPECNKILGLDPGISTLTAHDLETVVHPDDRARLRETLQTALNSRERYECEFRIVRATGETRWVANVGKRSERAQDREIMIGTLIDVTRRKGVEAHNAMLMRELAHRTKNLIAVIQSIAGQTLKNSRSLEDFREPFMGRVQALAVSIDRLVRQNWSGADLASLVKEQTRPFIEPDSPRLQLEGPQLMVSSETAQNLGLALHELATNAAKYGAWSSSKGRVAICWSVCLESSPPSFRMVWKEKDGPAVQAATKEGFGTTVITLIAAGALNGEVKLDHASDGVRWELNAPLGKISEAGSDAAAVLAA